MKGLIKLRQTFVLISFSKKKAIRAGAKCNKISSRPYKINVWVRVCVCVCVYIMCIRTTYAIVVACRTLCCVYNVHRAASPCLWEKPLHNALCNLLAKLAYLCCKSHRTMQSGSFIWKNAHAHTGYVNIPKKSQYSPENDIGWLYCIAKSWKTNKISNAYF